MGRAERRKYERKKRKETSREKVRDRKDDVEFTVTRRQLNGIIERTIRPELDKVKQQAKDDAVNVALKLMFGLPMKVLMDHYWMDNYERDLPGFADHLVDYYTRWQDGELDIDAVAEELWEYGGVRLEECDRE